MKFATQENLIPGSSFREKVAKLEQIGYEGIELNGSGLLDRANDIKVALKHSPIVPTCICGGFKFGLLFPDKSDRDQSINEIKELLTLAAEVGAKEGVIVVPIFGPPQLPDLSPYKTAQELEEELLIEELIDLTRHAQEVGTKVILEPLNRYETHLINRLDQAIAICEKVNSPNLTVLADFFHMNIEESHIGDSLRRASNHIGYVHLADSNRVLPGEGHTDFREGFAALKEISYRGWMSLECKVQGEPETALAESLKFMKLQF